MATSEEYLNSYISMPNGEDGVLETLPPALQGFQTFIDDTAQLFPEESGQTITINASDENGDPIEQVVDTPHWFGSRDAERSHLQHQTELAAILLGQNPAASDENGQDADDDSDNGTIGAIDTSFFLDEEDETAYYLFDWKELSPEVQSAAIELGYTESTWEEPAKDTPETTYAYNKDWWDLSEVEQGHASTLGYEEKTWQESDDDGAVDPPKGKTAAILFSWDKEAKRIFQIAFPSTVGSATSTITSAVSSALISYNFGTSNYIAYSMAYVVLGLADALYGGIGSASSILVAQAIGAGNKYLAGQYEQAAFIVDYFFAIPLYTIVWVYFVEIIEFMGLERKIGELGLLFLPWLFLSYPISDVSGVISELMWAEERGGTMTIIDNVYNIVFLGLLVCLIFGHESLGIQGQPTLTHLGFLNFLGSVLYFLMTFFVVECRGWLEPYKKGLVRSWSIKNWKLVKSIVTMSVPLTIGGIVSTCEWELLTIFAAHMGSPEVAAWTILGSIWGIFEYFPTGFTTAAELRVSRHLGNGNPGLAKIAAYKSMLFSVITTTFITIFFCYFRNEVIGFYTNVEVIQEMLSDLILLVGIANIVMVIGVVAYTILCAQNRTNLATGTYAFLSFATTLPMSVYYVFVKGYDLQSIVFSLIVGYSLSSLVLVVFLLTTNWTRCSERVIRKATKAKHEQGRLSRLRVEKDLNKQVELAERNFQKQQEEQSKLEEEKAKEEIMKRFEFAEMT